MKQDRFNKLVEAFKAAAQERKRINVVERHIICEMAIHCSEEQIIQWNAEYKKLYPQEVK